MQGVKIALLINCKSCIISNMSYLKWEKTIMRQQKTWEVHRILNI